jgi:endonuclease YncB( thermonuclease family)
MHRIRQNFNVWSVGLCLIGLAGIGVAQHWQSSSSWLLKERSPDSKQVLASTDRIEVPISEQWEVTKVSDGDTLTVRQGSKEQKVRLCGVDAPEKAQPLGMEAKAKLQQLVDAAGGKVAIVPVDRDRYGRTVAEVFLMTEPEQSVQQELLTAGMVYVYPQYIDGCPNATGFKMAEAIAQQGEVGVWAKSYERPWQYRKAKK